MPTLVVNITLTQINVREFRVRFDPLRITVLYDVMTSTGQIWKSSERTFWQEVPVPPVGESVPASWTLLPAAYAGQLMTMLSAAVGALETAELT